MYSQIKKIMFVVTNMFEILGILSCLYLFSVMLSHESIEGIFKISLVIPVVILFILTGLSYFSLSRYYPIEDKRFLFSIMEISMILFSMIVIGTFTSLYSLVMFISIINLAFYLILLCEVSIYFVNSCRKMKDE